MKVPGLVVELEMGRSVYTHPIVDVSLDASNSELELNCFTTNGDLTPCDATCGHYKARLFSDTSASSVSQENRRRRLSVRAVSAEATGRHSAQPRRQQRNGILSTKRPDEKEKFST